ncbi:carbohydrate kinase family protein [Streptomyces armeniacus]|uniref:Carbohydrate kinase family protein n=1 Tax=Streptomyces armeniacus TaxID=83291 RepID=A0A345XSK5_9ACTN|nr:carbohydrate kinase family protein [Streptomyces armeniacus]AXK34621.1 carbohydrate kinase family protein [Streptomyces armeniacus]
MSPPFDLLVIGDANPDVVLGPVPGALAYGQREQLVAHGSLVLGGSAAIAACGAARLGLRVAFAGRVGDDPAGAFVRHALAERGVDTGALTTDPELPTPLTTVLTRGTDRAILTAPGCLPATGPHDVPGALLGGTRHVHAASFFLLPELARALPEVFRAAQAHGATTSLDTNDDPDRSWDPELLAPVLRRTDFLLPNADEAHALAASLGAAPVTGADALTAAAAELAGYGPLVAVKNGADGALAHDGIRTWRAAPVPVDPLDTVGAGDSFDAGFLAALLRGEDTARALQLAAACGALSTRAHGGTAAQPDWDEAVAAAHRPAPASVQTSAPAPAPASPPPSDADHPDHSHHPNQRTHR